MEIYLTIAALGVIVVGVTRRAVRGETTSGRTTIWRVTNWFFAKAGIAQFEVMRAEDIIATFLYWGNVCISPWAEGRAK